ncbi:tryptophan synthase beta subunit-like PLP-dependent enzyme [Microdochium trichocladiopsis]|uniref:L-serine ammonia-lyase n=1 Tax=Microdochium trichocladiopsis TaxID=1682393 RepID=A0A9P8YBU3_9PEZI|nr:tryptophan synthase beta subunit-like PLP-dependent enzyme [Microdochium trichocladiopsis]KAH7033449.1 tryptophan synthase beta subunit-like PLP-dependent enzyme [Microdochium trichocladiopsis]
MGSHSPEPQKLWVETSCIPSLPLSRAAGCNIFLKLENLQPSGSFKSRGIGSMMYRAFLERCSSLGRAPASSSSAHDEEPIVHFYCSSGGNAGLACATAAATLGQPCTIVVPTLVTPFMTDKLRALGAEVVQIGENWAVADAHLRENLLSRDAERGVYVPPFDHPHVWHGASGMVDEIIAQVSSLGGGGVGGGSQRDDAHQVDAIVCSCGGGGLLNGIMEGVKRHAKASSQTTENGGPVTPPRVLAVETVGAESLDASIKAGRLVTLPAITSIATSLGAPTVSARTFQWAREAPHLSNLVVSDADAVMGSVRFADDARILVEVACGAAICPAYNGDLRRCLGQGLSDEEWSRKNVVLVVCGGSNVSLDILRGYREKYNVHA